MKRLIILCLLVLGGLIWSPISAQQSSPAIYDEAVIPKRVLFIGNSYTHYWNLYQQVAEMAKSQGVSLYTRQSTAGGATLGHHWRGDRDLNSMSLIKRGRFDAVVLQDQSMRAIQHPDSLLYFGHLLGEKIKEERAQVYLYLTWSREKDPAKQAIITEKYQALAAKTDAIVVPVGLAWAKARSLNPDIRLYDRDGSHPSALGTYLTSCVFYGALTGKSPIGLPARLVERNERGINQYLNIEPTELATFCQEVAEEVLQMQNKKE